MNIKQISYIFSICIIVRLLLTYLVYKNYNNKFRYLFIIFYIIAGLGLLYLYIKPNSRKQGSFGEKIWWEKYRIIHSILFLSVSFLLYNKNKHSWKLLLLDTLIALFGHIKYHYL
jgi:hypothetical protein